jgi:hypothetical protein
MDADPLKTRRLRTEQENDRLVRLLEAAVRLSLKSFREIDRELGYSAGSVHRLFSRKSELKTRHVLEILDVLKVSPRVFFTTAYSVDHPKDQTTEQLMEMLGRSGLSAAEQANPSPTLRQIEEIVAKAMARVVEASKA